MASPRSLFLLLFAALIVPSVASTAAAQEPVIGGAEAIEIESYLCRKLAVNPDETAQHGYLKMITAPKGKAFLVVWSKLKLSFGKNEDGEEVVYLEDEHISIKDSKGNVAYSVGTCAPNGVYGEYSAYISEYEEYLDSDEIDFHPVFVVPEDEQEFTLQLGPNAKKFTGPMQVAETIDRSSKPRSPKM